jgi:Na+-translocating ferredoxin:NAD+ oxidoreductase RnfD subunit
MWRRVKKFFRTPKGLLIVILLLLAAIAAPAEGIRTVAPGFVIATIAAGLVDLLILRAGKKVWEFPSGAVLTAMIVAMVLRAQEPWYVTTITSVGAILSKYLVRSRSANVFNPAALGIVASYYVFHTGQSWWGALPELPPFTLLVLLAAGVYIAGRVNKAPLVLAFLGTYFLLFTITAFVADPQWVAEIFRPPDVQAALFLSFVILTDPPTSPTRYPDQIVCGVIVATVSYAFFEWAGVVYYLLAGVLAGNVWEAWRRTSRRVGHTFPRGVSIFLREIGPNLPGTPHRVKESSGSEIILEQAAGPFATATRPGPPITRC